MYYQHPSGPTLNYESQTNPQLFPENCDKYGVWIGMDGDTLKAIHKQFEPKTYRRRVRRSGTSRKRKKINVGTMSNSVTLINVEN